MQVYIHSKKICGSRDYCNLTKTLSSHQSTKVALQDQHLRKRPQTTKMQEVHFKI